MRWTAIMLTLVLIFASNAIFVHPREMSSDTSWLLQQLRHEEVYRDVRRLGPLQITPTRVALGERVQVSVAETANVTKRALVMIDNNGNHLDTRYDPLQTQSFVIPRDGTAGDYRFWLAGSSLEARSGLGVITVEVYDPVPGNLRHASVIEVTQTFIQATQQNDLDLVTACFSGGYFADPSRLAEFIPPPEVLWLKGELLYSETEPQEGQQLRSLVRVDMQISYPEDKSKMDFWGDGSSSRYLVMQQSEDGWRISSWNNQWPQEFIAWQPIINLPVRTQPVIQEPPPAEPINETPTPPDTSQEPPADETGEPAGEAPLEPDNTGVGAEMPEIPTGP